MKLHPITAESFAIIDAEIGPHTLTDSEYRVVRRVIHSTADFEYKDLLRFEHGAIEQGVQALRAGIPVVVDVQMVKSGVTGVALTNPLYCALDAGTMPGPGETRTEAGLNALVKRFPQAVYVIGNAPTALHALARAIHRGDARPALVVAVPVGFVQVVQAKAAIGKLAVPQIRVEGRKGGSPVAAGIINALASLAFGEDDEKRAAQI